MVFWKASNALVASLMDGPMNMSAQSRQGPSSTRLPSTRMSLQSHDSAPWATMRLMPLDLPAPGSPPSSMLRSARLTNTCSPFSSMPRWIGSNMENGNPAGVMGGMRGVPPFRDGGQGPGGSAGDPAVAIGVPGQVAVVAGGEDDAFAVASAARLVAVQVDRDTG